MKVKFEYYKAFYYVAKYGSLTLASQVMGVTQPSLSKTIIQLEKDLNCALFNRRHMGMQLTAEGKILYRYISNACENILQGEKVLDSLLNFGSGEIHIGSSDIILKSFLLPQLAAYHLKYDKIRLRTHIITASQSAQMLRDGIIDMAIVTSPPSKTKDLQCKEIGEVHDIFVAGEKFSYLKGKTFTFQEIINLPLICPGPNTGQRQFCDNFFYEHNLLLNPEFELATAMLVPAFAQEGLGVGLVMREVVKKDIDSGNIFEVKTKIPLTPRKFSIVTLKDAQLSCATKELIKTLNNAFATPLPHQKA